MNGLTWSEFVRTMDQCAVVPDGRYELAVGDARAAQSALSGKDIIQLRFSVTAGDFLGRIIHVNWVLSPGDDVALSFLIRKLFALGIMRDYLAQNPTLEQVAAALIGRRCLADVVLVSFNGSERNDIERVTPFIREEDAHDIG